MTDHWHPVEDWDGQADIVELRDLKALSEVTHPIRGRLMRRLRVPRSAAALAEVLDVPVTRLYHHLNLLESIGLIRVVATRRVGAATERQYQSIARTFTVAIEPVDQRDRPELAAAFGSLFDVAKLGFQREIELGTYDQTTVYGETSTLSLRELQLSPKRRAELMARLQAVINDYDPEVDGDLSEGERVVLFVAAYPETP
ncbi:MAG: hypothetical protein CSA55_00850 [Ilumatobacter coccineus]|uniref:ArsR family transcriptional regulator n=1 Tax=Ilumatobacter coccineus TaxID=467094 RepID=A0A2G6KI10_9ACTN|nr:MAG: hypothetical protein CSA55_00850 [Ilumatobacter coccineus]